MVGGGGGRLLSLGAPSPIQVAAAFTLSIVELLEDACVISQEPGYLLSLAIGSKHQLHCVSCRIPRIPQIARRPEEHMTKL